MEGRDRRMFGSSQASECGVHSTSANDKVEVGTDP